MIDQTIILDKNKTFSLNDLKKAFENTLLLNIKVVYKKLKFYWNLNIYMLFIYIFGQ